MFKIENIFIQTDVLNFKYCLYISRLPTTQFFNENKSNLPKKKTKKCIKNVFRKTVYVCIFNL